MNNEDWLYGQITINLEPLRSDSNVAVYEDGRPLSQSEKRARRAAHAIDLELKSLRRDLLEHAYDRLGL